MPVAVLAHGEETDGSFWSSLAMLFSDMARDRSGKAVPDRQASTPEALCVSLDRSLVVCVTEHSLQQGDTSHGLSK